jgi:hypothetical protein
MIRRSLCVIGVLALLASPVFAAKGSGGGHAKSSGSHSKSTHASSSKKSQKNQSVAVGRTAHGKIARSETAKRDFMKQTGYPNGRPGYVIDHVKPLACGGADTPSNMQWQTVAEAKAKDKTERIGCR